ncbi:MAG: endonuclease MutS2 [Spirochaetales bacterium]
MNRHTLELLEFQRVREEVESYTFSEEGRNRLAQEPFLTQPKDLEKVRELVGAFRKLYDQVTDFPSLRFPAISDTLRKVEKAGAQLEGVEIAQIAEYLHQASLLKNFLLKQKGALKEQAEDLPDLSHLFKELKKFIDPEGVLKEQEIPSLRAIGERIRTLRKELEKIAYSFLQHPSYRGFWQTDTPTLKDGRIVLPLNANYRGKIRGIVHEVSSRGTTLFIEPLELFERNNKLVDEQNEYQWEVGRILRELTEKIHNHFQEIQFQREVIALLDSRQARARYGHLHHCSFAAIEGEGLALRQARHPLLGTKAVPIDINFTSTRMVILSGPNTGGKTVALKTLGLLVVMNQFGMEIPALDSTLPLFDDVYTDIGDEQSLAASLSTFSAHIKNLNTIYQNCSERSLLLLDELGAGTDPEEGVALAIAFLEAFKSKNVFLLGTTHLGGVKNYVFSEPDMLNGSVEFDLQTMKPTYRIILGVPGPSYALEIAEQCGAPLPVLQRARELLKERATQTEKLMGELLQRLQEYQQKMQEVEKVSEELQSQKLCLEKREKDLKFREIELREKGIDSLQIFLKEARKELEKLIRTLREGVLEKEKIQQAQSFLRSLEKTLEKEIELQEEEKNTFIRFSPSLSLSPGMEVKLRSHHQKGVLLRKIKEKMWEVGFGNLRMRVQEGDIEEVGLPQKKREILYEEERSSPVVQWELDLRGYRVEEALKMLEKQIDGALLSGLKEFGIIHGKGEGILQQAVHQYLAQCPLVEAFTFAPPEAGGTGKTLVKMK